MNTETQGTSETQLGSLRKSQGTAVKWKEKGSLLQFYHEVPAPKQPTTCTNIIQFEITGLASGPKVLERNRMGKHINIYIHMTDI